jgi:hypothetical protein
MWKSRCIYLHTDFKTEDILQCKERHRKGWKTWFVTLFSFSVPTVAQERAIPRRKLPRKVMYQGISYWGKTLYSGVANETHCMRECFMYTHTHTQKVMPVFYLTLSWPAGRICSAGHERVNAPESFITAPNTAALWRRKLESARTCDSCGAQHIH